MNKEHENKKIKISNSGLSPTNTVPVYNHLGETIHAKVAGELPLTIKINNTEIITLMTLGTRPEELTLGYLRNQGIINNIDEIISIDVKWDIGVSNVVTKHKDIKEITDKLKNKTVTTGCGQGTIFSCTLDKLYDNLLPDIKIKRSEIFDLLAKITKYNDIYKEAGAVHGCALCDKDKVIEFVEAKKITAGHAKILVGLENATFVANKIIEKKLSVRQTENFVKIFKKKGKNLSKIKDTNISALEQSIVDNIGINVSIKNKKNNKGTIAFEYKDLDQLNKIIDIIKKNY